MSELIPWTYNPVSPFEAIKRTDAEGDYWTARDLCGLMQYSEWSKFKPVLDRARQALANMGPDAESHLRPMSSSYRTAGAIVADVGREDVRLSKFGAFIVAQNGDPRNPAVAGAQWYFTAQTHFAETVQAQAPAYPPGVLDFMRGTMMLAEQHESKIEALAARAQDAEARIEALEYLTVQEFCARIGLKATDGQRRMLGRVVAQDALDVEPHRIAGSRLNRWTLSRWRLGLIAARKMDCFAR